MPLYIRKIPIMFLMLVNLTKSPAAMPNTHKARPLVWYDGRQKIGEGVTITAHILYDSKDFAELVPEQKIPKYFDELFQKVRELFNNNTIMISINIIEATLKTDVEVIESRRHTLEGNETLRKLQSYASTTGVSKDSIVYLFTQKTPYNKYHHFAFAGAFTDFSTNATFCTKTTSAAIIQHTPGSGRFWPTVRATARIFGTRNFFRFTEGDMKTLTETFKHCPGIKETKFDHGRKPTYRKRQKRSSSRRNTIVI
ncbi:uncharacterized protein LOC125939964 [Dermacentor silvarum]|uniref:uncharacterized protein LOC125939964 n=1 Tax=Dermacentor silvarum TaxID=543639 RepID=UPI002101B599|nr:uncharacterized protein LOC125939964 [Dermacentor silvarum]